MKFRCWIIFLLGMLFAFHCAIFHRGGQRIRIKGSDTMAALTQHWAEAFMKRHPHISVYTEAGGTKTGLQALLRGEADICTASRPILADEMKQLSQRYGRIGFEHLIGKDALLIYLHPENPVDDLTLTQIKDIFAGKITNWKEVGGRDEPILVLSRPIQSGSHQYFREHVLDGAPFTTTAEILPTTRSIVEVVTQRINAIGYGGVAFKDLIKACKVNGIAPTKENLRNDSYAIVRYLYLYTIDKPLGVVKLFVDWAQGPEGQKIVEQAGYLPLWRH